jgi:hypothetical protein
MSALPRPGRWVSLLCLATVGTACSLDPVTFGDAGSGTYHDEAGSETNPMPEARDGAGDGPVTHPDAALADAAALGDAPGGTAIDGPTPADGAADAAFDAAPPPPTPDAPLEAASPDPDAAVDSAPPVPTPDASLEAARPDARGCEPGSCKPIAQWVQTATGESDIQTRAGRSTLVGNAGGDLYLAANFRRNAVVGGRAVTNTSELDRVDAFIASFNPAGVAQWVRVAGGRGEDGITGVDLDKAGNLYLTGWYQQTLSLAGKTLTGGISFLASLGAAGQPAWLENLATSDITNWVVAVDPAGNLYVSGRYNASVVLGDLKLTGDSSNKLFVASFGPDRKVRWLRDLGASFGPSIVVRGVDDIILAGSYEELRLDGKTWKAKSFWDVFFTALGPGGVPTWTTVFPGPPAINRGLIAGLGVDSAGGVYATGHLADPTGTKEVSVVALTAAGAPKWSLTAAAIGAVPQQSALAVGADDGVYFAAHLAGNVSFGDQTFQQQEDTYVVRFDTDGNTRWAMNLGSNSVWPVALAPLPGGRIGLAGPLRNVSSILGLPLRVDGAPVAEGLYLLSLKQQ